MTKRREVLEPVLTAVEMREWESRSFSSGVVQERVVLESAGRAVAAAVAEAFPTGRVVGVVGGGNNGGDALVALRTLRAWGREVVAVPAGGGEMPTGLAHGWEIPIATGETAFDRAGVILDGILGTGAAGAPREPLARVVEAINATGRPVVAIDGPTGVDLTTGDAPGAAISAHLTVTFGALKRGLLLYPGRSLAGRILLAEVGFPPLDGVPVGAAVITDGWARARLPSIAADAHKGRVGLVGILAGRKGVGGAAIMAAMGALRAGCGGVRVASSEANRLAIHAAVPEAVFVDRDSPELHESLGGTAALLVGPGIGVDDATHDLLVQVVSRFEGPMLLDADALTLLAQDPGMLPESVARRCVLTPHPGELARLLDRAIADVLADRIGSAAEAAEAFGCAVLAKGAPSLVAAPGEPVLIGLSGHSGVATGGMGDTLGGIVAALLAGGAGPRDAAASGLHFAGRAAEAAGRGRGLLPRDVAEALPGILLDASAAAPLRPPFLLDLSPPE